MQDAFQGVSKRKFIIFYLTSTKIKYFTDIPRGVWRLEFSIFRYFIKTLSWVGTTLSIIFVIFVSKPFKMHYDGHQTSLDSQLWSKTVLCSELIELYEWTQRFRRWARQCRIYQLPIVKYVCLFILHTQYFECFRKLVPNFYPIVLECPHFDKFLNEWYKI